MAKYAFLDAGAGSPPSPAALLELPLDDQVAWCVGIKADVVIMTQACDLEQGKVSDVVLCPCRPLSRYKPVWDEAERARKQGSSGGSARCLDR